VGAAVVLLEALAGPVGVALLELRELQILAAAAVLVHLLGLAVQASLLSAISSKGDRHGPLRSA
jgi:hypothetical protein